MNAPHLRLLGGQRPTRPVRPRGLSTAESKVYGELRRRLSVAQAVDVAYGIDPHGCSAREQSILARVMGVNALPVAA